MENIPVLWPNWSKFMINFRKSSMCAWKECDWDPVVYVCLYIKFAIVFNRCHMRWPTKYLIRRWLRLYSCSPRVCLSFLQLWHCCSVTRSCLTLRPHGLQHARLPWPSPSHGVCPNSCPLSRWCYHTISPPVTPFSSCLQSFPPRILCAFNWC